MELDLSQFDTVRVADEGTALHLRDPLGRKLYREFEDGRKEPVTITLLGADSKKHNGHLNAIANRRMKRRSEAGVRPSPMTAEELDEDALEMLVFDTAAWSNIVVDGEEWPCDKAHARKLYDRFPWIREQAQAWVDGRGNYLGES